MSLPAAIVVWIVSYVTGCPSDPDPYGRLSGAVNAVACVEYSTKTKDFETLKAAKEFVENAPEDLRPSMKIYIPDGEVP